MGLQQILLIVLGVIVVGVAITVGIVMFGSQAYNSNRSALMTEMQYFSTLALQYWRLPTSLGGAGQSADNVDLGFLASFMGFSDGSSKVVSVNYSYTSDNGEYRVKLGNVDTLVIITGLGKEVKKGMHPKVTLTLDLTTGNSSVDTGEAEDFD